MICHIKISKAVNFYGPKEACLLNIFVLKGIGAIGTFQGYRMLAQNASGIFGNAVPEEKRTRRHHLSSHRGSRWPRAVTKLILTTC